MSIGGQMTERVEAAQSAPRPPAPLRVADSFRVLGAGANARVIGFSRHLSRFLDAATAALRERPDADAELARADLATQVADALPRIAAYGDGFPRLELRERFQLSLRPLPALTTELALRTVAGFALEHPERKGPNLERLQAENRRLGAEALLVDHAGSAIEGATTSLLWWRANTLLRVATGERVPSVTEALVTEHAQRIGIRVEGATAAPSDIVNSEVWAVNALHGIRPVTSIDGARLPHPDRARLDAFRTALAQCAEPVLGLRDEGWAQ